MEQQLMAKKKYYFCRVLSNMDGNVQNVPVRLKLKSQLRTGYAERYQAIASQYSSRIGVDYVSMMLP